MKYILNKLKTKTTNNFKVNNIQLDLDLPNTFTTKDYIIKNISSINTTQVNKKLETNIGLTLPSYRKVDLTIPKYMTYNTPIIIEFDFTNEDNLVEYFNITFEESSSSDIIIISKSLDNTKSFHFYKESITMHPNSKGSVTLINLLNSNSQNFYEISSTHNKSSHITHNIIDLGSNIKLSNMASLLNSYNAVNILNNIYLGVDNNILDMNYYLTNNYKNTTNIINAVGVLDDNSSKIFRGIIDFKEGAVKSVGKESENCILLTDNATSRSLPELLCHEEDVDGSHGLSTGKVDKEKLFYLMTRGFTEDDAKRIIIQGYFSSIIKEIPDEAIREEVKDFINKKI